MAMLLPALDLWRETSRWDAPPRIVQTHPCGPGDGMTNPMVRSLVPGILPENILANIPKTKQDTFFLLDRVQRHHSKVKRQGFAEMGTQCENSHERLANFPARQAPRSPRPI